MERSNLGSKKGIKIEELASGKLPEKVVNSVGKLKLTVGDLHEWYVSRPPMYFAFSQGEIAFDLRIRWSIKRVLAIAGSLIGLIWAILNFVFDYLPKIREWLSRT